MNQNHIRFRALALLCCSLGLLVVTAVFRRANAPVERDIATIQADMTEAWSSYEAEREARCAEQLRQLTWPTQDLAISRETAQDVIWQAQPSPTTPEAARCPAEPRSVLFGGNMLYEGQEFEGEITHYCAEACCNGKWAGVTADGTVLDEDTEPVVGCQWLPFDAVVEFNGKQHRVADTGGKEFETVGRLDVYVPEGHQSALDAGRQKVAITIIRLPGGVV